MAGKQDPFAAQLARHVEAVAAPRGVERPILRMIEAWEAYRTEYARTLEAPIGDDGVLGEEWAAIGDAIHALLNGPTGRLDCGTLSTRIRVAQAKEGFER